MGKIKTREKAKGKDIKVLDKSAVVGQRMKNAFIRSKQNAAALMDDCQATPSEYVGDKVEVAMIRRMWRCPAQRRRYARGENCSSASGRNGRRRSGGRTPPLLNRPSLPNRAKAPPRRARPTGHPRRGGCRVSVPTRPGMNKSPNSAPTRPRTGGSPGNVPTPPRRNHAPSSIEARRNADGPLSALMGNALLMPLIR